MSGDVVEPGGMVVVAVDDVKSEFGGVARAFVFADVVFCLGMDVGVEVVERGALAVSDEPFKDGGATGGAAGV